MNHDEEQWLGSLDETVIADKLAHASCYSRAQFYRRVHRSLGGSPMAMRRRLLLERAAFELTRSKRAVTEIAFDAAFASLEGFSRAFRRAFGRSPSEHRRLGPSEYRLDPQARLHFVPNPIPGQGEPIMQTPELMTEHHAWHTAKLLDRVAAGPDSDLDRVMQASEPLPWMERKATLRQMLGRASAFAAPWMHAINGIETDYSPATIPEMREALERSRIAFLELIRSVANDDSWNLTFVDGVCDPPEVFSYGGVIGHVLTFNAYRRLALITELKSLGHEGLGYGDPIEYLRR